MYLYFDRNGALKEIINNDAIRKGNNNANKVYCYFEDEPSLDYLTAIVKLPDRTLTNEIFFEDNVVEETVPYNPKADYKYFKDFEKYRFYVLNLEFALSQSGLYKMTIRAFINDRIFALGEIIFNAENNIINSDNGITQSQYDYLIRIVKTGIFVPSISAEGVLSWENTKDLPNPEPVNIRGPRGYSVSRARQTQTSTEDEGVNIVEFVLENRTVVGEIAVRNGSKGERGEDAVNAVWFEIDEDTGHLIVYYSGETAPDIYLVSDDENSDSYYETLGVSASLVGHLVFIYNVEKARIYGVDGAGQSSPILTRTDRAVGLTYSVGESEISSDFDNCYPWSDMQEIVDEDGNVFIKIPKFYSKVTKNANGTYKHQISGVRYSGFSTLFVDGKGNEIDYVLVGKYEASGSSARAYSKSGQNPLVSITLPTMRTACKANGAGYQQYDFLIDAIIKELFMIEFATTNSQNIMYGYANGNSAAIQTGNTDVIETPSGSPTSNSSGTYACKYRGIENPWGNVWKWVDGITFSAEKVYVCLDPENYVSEDTSMPYTYVGDRLMNEGYLKEIGYFAKLPLLGYAKTNGASSSTYYSDYNNMNSGGTLLYVGGNWSAGSAAGLWCWYGTLSASIASSQIGGRLCYKPLP